MTTSMFWLFLTIVCGVILLFLSEKLRRAHKINNELTRKSVHAVRACVVASWPLFVSYKFIIWTEILFLLATIIAHHGNLFHWLRDVGRKTWGEFFFPAGIIITALLAPPPWIFAAAMLHLGLADSLAAIVGSRFGKKSSFKILGYKKSRAGFVAFWAASLIILSLFVLTHQTNFGGQSWSVLLVTPLVLAALETVSVWGTDNLVVPLTCWLLLIPFA